MSPEDFPAELLTARTDDVLDWCGRDVERLHVAYAAETARHPAAQRAVVLTELGTRLGGWPLPDTPVAEVLAGAGTPGQPVGRVFDREQARPPWARRLELVAALEQMTRAAGKNAYALEPVR